MEVTVKQKFTKGGREYLPGAVIKDLPADRIEGLIAEGLVEKGTKHAKELAEGAQNLNPEGQPIPQTPETSEPNKEQPAARKTSKRGK